MDADSAGETGKFPDKNPGRYSARVYLCAMKNSLDFKLNLEFFLPIMNLQACKNHIGKGAMQCIRLIRFP